MTKFFWKHTARPPRHAAAESNGVVVTVERENGRQPAKVGAQLCELSRRGVRLGVSHELNVCEEVVVCIGERDTDFEVRLTGQVRWCRRETDGSWLAGCSLTNEITWETYGEFFLRGILACDDQLTMTGA